MSITLALAACVPALRPATEASSLLGAHSFFIRFDNDGQQHVHVYLIDERRQWLLGRVEPGALAIIRIPDAAIAEISGFVRLAVIKGEGVTLEAARDPRAALTVAAPVSAIMAQRWWFGGRELLSLGPVVRPRPIG